MFSRIGHLLLIIAVLGATGAHWAALQSVAWATMLADNARVASFSDALEKTFDGRHPCALCKQIAKGRQNEKKSETQFSAKKLEFLRQSSVFVIISPTDFRLMGSAIKSFEMLNEAPPVPPPRSLPV